MAEPFIDELGQVLLDELTQELLDSSEIVIRAERVLIAYGLERLTVKAAVERLTLSLETAA